jgi:hypothetical protein
MYTNIYENGFNRKAAATCLCQRENNTTTAQEQKMKVKDGESDYQSEEDEDFKDEAFSDGSSDESESAKRRKAKPQEVDSGDEATIRTRKSKRRNVEGDEILTRAQKRARYVRRVSRLREGRRSNGNRKMWLLLCPISPKTLTRCGSSSMPRQVQTARNH